MAVQYDRWGEPIPLKLTGPIERAWQRVLTANEWFDGETGIQYGAQQRLIREWNENKPSRVTEYVGFDAAPSRTDFPTRREAEAYADRCNADLIEVTTTP